MSLSRRDFVNRSTLVGAGVLIAGNELNIGSAGKPEFGEFTGVTFSDDGRTLFANIQEPGIQPAVSGPWRRLNEHRRSQGYGA
ncbi:hypothetical protein BG452_28495 [Streptomyces sp. CBMA123]|nr:hypothetical protein [Streptomyces sp. CBMA123]